MVTHAHNIHYNADNTYYREAYHTREDDDGCVARILAERKQQSALCTEREEWLFGWHGEHGGYDRAAQDDSEHKGAEHGVAIASDAGFFVLLQILYGVEVLLESGDEGVAVVEGGSGCEEESSSVLSFFILSILF